MAGDDRMLWSERRRRQTDHALEHRLGLLIVTAIAVKNREAFDGWDQVRVIRAKVLFPDGQRAAIARFSQRVVPRFLRDDAEIGERRRHPQALGSVQLLREFQRPREEFLRADVVPLPPMDQADVVQREGDDRMRTAQAGLSNRQRPAVSCERGRVVTPAITEQSQVHHVVGDLWMIGSEYTLSNRQRPEMTLLGRDIVVRQQRHSRQPTQ